MTVAKAEKGKSEARVGSNAGGSSRVRCPGMPVEDIRKLFMRVGIVGKLREQSDGRADTTSS